MDSLVIPPANPQRAAIVLKIAEKFRLSPQHPNGKGRSMFRPDLSDELSVESGMRINVSSGGTNFNLSYPAGTSEVLSRQAHADIVDAIVARG